MVNCVLTLWNELPWKITWITLFGAVVLSSNGFLGNISILNKIMYFFIHIEHLLVFPRGTYHSTTAWHHSEIFFRNKYISYPKRTWISPVIIQLNFIPFRRMFPFAVWKYYTFQRKIVAIRWVLVFQTPICPPSPSDIPEWAFSHYKGSVYYLRQGSLLPPALPEDPSICAPFHQQPLPVCCITIGMKSYHAHLTQCSHCPCGHSCHI